MSKPKYKTEWDLNQLYNGPSDKKIAKDLAEMQELSKKFAKKYRGKITSANTTTLAKALQEYEVLFERVAYAKPFVYAFLARDIDQENSKLTELFNSVYQQVTELGNLTVFFELELADRGYSDLMKVAKDKKLITYRYFIEKIAQNSKYRLTEPEEKILNLTSQTSVSMWEDGVEKAISKKSVQFGGKDVPLNGALERMYDVSTKQRHELQKKMIERYKEVSDFAESELNALLTHRKMTDGLRGYKRPQSMTIQGYENTEKEIDTLVQTVTSNYKISHEFFSLKKELFGLDGIHFSDRRAVLAKLPQLTFEKVSDDLLTILAGVKTEYHEVFRSMLEKGNLDVYTKKGKRGGGYQLGGIGFTPFILLNYNPGFRAATTLAHEIGHAIHSERSKKQTPLNQLYSTAAAETASTFFESMYVDHLINSLPKKYQIALLHDKLHEEITSIFYTISVYRLEEEYHEIVRQKGAISNDELVRLMNHHMSAYVGKDAKFTPDDGYFYVHLLHLRRPFYMYTYAYGHMISKLMLEHYQADPSYIDKVDYFLSAGCSESPAKIFKHIGIDTSKAAVFENALASIKKDITRLKKLAKQEGMLK